MTPRQTFTIDMAWLLLLKDLGVRPEHVLKKAALPEDLFSRPERGLTTAEYFRFWQSLEETLDNPRFPLLLVETVTAESFVPPIFAALCSKNMAQASERLAKYKTLIAPMRLDITLSQDRFTLSPQWLDATDTIPFAVVAAELAFLMRLIRLGTREPIKALAVGMPLLPASSSVLAYADFFGAAVQHSPAPYLTIVLSDAEMPFLTANDGMWQVFEPELRKRLSELNDTASMGERVQALLLELLPSGDVRIQTVARRLAMSPRTLQRRLDDEHESFRALVNHTRERLARHYLSQTSLTSGEISFLLGFEDPNSFYRAFHDWTGSTPDAMRTQA